MERNTRQREAIRGVFDRSDRPLSPQEVHERAGRAAAGVSMATVYRTLKALVAEGALVAVELPGQAPRYEPAGLQHHHHFQCRVCGRVYDIHGCPGRLDRLAPAGFVVEGHEITLRGVCERCGSAA